MSIFNRRRDDIWDPFGDWDWENPFGLSLFGHRSPFHRTFEDFDRVFELAEKGELPPVGEGGPYIYASSTYVGPDGIPQHKEVKNFEGELPTASPFSRLGWRDQRKALPEGSQRPHYEIQTSEKELTLTVDLPGLSKKDIELETSGSSLHLKGEVEGTQRKYRLDLKLPKPVIPGRSKASFKNGILDLVLPLATTSDTSKKIKID